jgi:ABC-type amino acid transport system permease subunit
MKFWINQRCMREGTSKMSTLLIPKEDALMKLKVIGYWATTAAVALELVVGGMTDLVHGGTMLVIGQPIVQILAREGYPLYLLTILGCWKIPGGIVLLAPRLLRLKEWAYCGAIIVYTSAFASGLVRGGDPWNVIWSPLIFTLLTLASWALRPQSRILGVLFPTQIQAKEESGR